MESDRSLRAMHAPDPSVMSQAAKALTPHLPELTDRLVREFSEVEGLTLVDDSREQLWGLCYQGLRAALEALERPHDDRADLRLATETGILWAGRGLRLDSLLRLYRLAGRLVWESLLQAAGPSGASTLVYLVGGVLRGIDQESSAAASSYRLAESRLLPHGQARISAAIDTLLGGGHPRTPGSGPSEADVEAAAEVLDLPLRGRYVVVALRPGAAAGLATPLGAGTYGGLRFFWRRGQVLVQLGTCDLDDVEQALRALASGHVGVGPLVEGLAELERSARYGELAVRTCREPGPQIARFDRTLPHGLLVAQPELAAELVREILGKVLALPVRYRRDLLETLETWLRCEGSATAAARVLYCHRNTVLHRLRRVQDLTRRSLGKPNDLVDLALALHALRTTELAAPVAPQPRPGQVSRPRRLAERVSR